MRSFAKWLIAMVALLCAVSSANAAVLGIDYGSEYVKVSIVAPGRTPISIVINEISKRKSTAAVAFTGGDRWLAEEAMNYNARFPDRVFTRLRDLLGKETQVDHFTEYLDKYKLPFKVTPDKERQTARIVTETGEAYLVEELVAMILQYAMKIGEGMGKGQIKDAVIAIPPYFGQTHRYALYDAADIAGLNILAEVSDLSCAALQWGIDKEFTPEGTWTIVYDMGATSVGAALVRYSTFEGKEAGKKKTHGQFEVKAVAWDASCGGEDMDMLLVDHFTKEFDDKHKPKVSSSKAPRAISKLRKQVRKTKEILSANKEAPMTVEGMHEDVDFRSSIKRTEFEALAEKHGVMECAVKPLQTILESLPDHNVTLKDIEVVEIIGGATRVPFIKTALSKALGGRSLDVHLDADEAVAMGAGLFAANMSTTFRMRKFGAADAAAYGLEVDLNDKEKPNERKPLIPKHKRFPVRRIVTIQNATEDRTFTVYHNVSDGQVLPPGIVEPTLGEFAVTGVKDAMEKHDNILGKINAHFAVDNSGILYMDKAEYQVEVFDMVEVEEPPPPKKAPAKEDKKDKKKKKGKKGETIEPDVKADDMAEEEVKTDIEAEADANADESTKMGRKLLADETVLEDSDGDDDVAGDVTTEETGEGDGGDESSEETSDTSEATDIPPKEKKFKERRRVFRTSLMVDESKRAVAAMSPDSVKVSISILKDLAAKDEAKRAQEAAKSNLEAYIYSIREKVEEDDLLKKVTDEAMRDKFSSELTEAEDWLYMDGAESTAGEFDAKKSELQAVGDEWITRAKELTKRPAAVAKARDFVSAALETIEQFQESKPWISDEEKQTLTDSLNGFVTWLDEKEELQAKLSDTERPAFVAAEVASEVKPLDFKLQKLKKRPAPPPPKEEVEENATDVNATETETTEGASGEDGDATEKEETEGEAKTEEGDATETDGDAEDHSELRR